MKRPMSVLGITVFIICFAFSLCGKQILPVTVIIGALVLFLYFIKPLKLREKIIIPTVCAGVFISSLLCFCFDEIKVEPCLKLDGRIADISGKVITDPVTINGKTSFTIKTYNIDNDNFETKIDIYIENGEEIKLYDVVSLYDVEVEVFKNANNRPDVTRFSDGVFLDGDCNGFSVLYESEKTPYYYCIKLKSIVTMQICSYLNTDEAGFLNGMLFGDGSLMSSDVLQSFRYSGVAHLLAVSGLHTTLWCGVLGAILNLFIKDKRKTSIICIIFLCFFCIVSAFTPSVLRASFMMLMVFLSPFFNKEQDSFNSLGLACALIALSNPFTVISPSFLLSVSATLGILILNNKAELFVNLSKKIKNYYLMKIVNYIVLSVAVSGIAGLFTLPVAVWFFGSFSLAAPITNILCVNVAFYGMIIGVIGLLISFIPVTVANTGAIFVFKCAGVLLKLVMTIVDKISDFKFCSVHIYKESLIVAALFCFVIVSIFLIINHFRYRKSFKVICCCICVIVTVISFSLPMTPNFGTQVTVHYAGNGMNVTLKSGLEYIHFIFNCEGSMVNYDMLPVSTSEKLKMLYIGSSDNNTNRVSSTFIGKYKPETTVVTEFVKEQSYLTGFEFPENTIIADEYKYGLNNEITVTTVDTYAVSCAIINLYGKNITLLYRGDVDEITKNYGKPDLLVTTKVFKDVEDKADTVIISSDESIIFDNAFVELKNSESNILSTAENGSVTINLREI